MNKKFFKIFSIILGILFLLLLVGNFGLNFWLKNKLPDYIKNNSNFLVTYKSLDVNLGTGNIFATDISINNKNPENQNIIRIKGTIDTLSISRLGIFDALFNEKVSTSNLVLNKPNLKIFLAKKKFKSEKDRNPFSVENIKITAGTIQIFKPTKQKLLSVNDLNLKVENLRLTKNTKDEKSPFSFDQYELNGKNLFYRTNDVYILTATYLQTKEGQFTIKDFALIPLLSPQNFKKFFPNRKNLLDLKSSEMEFKDLILKDNKIALNKVRFENPNLKIYTTNAKSTKSEGNSDFEVQLDNVLFNNANINIEKPNGSPLLVTEKLQLNLNNFLMNGETMENKIPFKCDNFKIEGKNIDYYSATEKVEISSLLLTPKSIDLRNVAIKPTVNSSEKMMLDFTAPQILLKIKDWSTVENKIKLNIDYVFVNKLSGKITVAKNPPKNISTFEGFSFPILIKNVNLKNANLVLESKNQPLAFRDLNAKIQNIELLRNSKSRGIDFKMGFYSFTTRDFNYKTKFYNLSSTLLKVNKNTIQVNNFAMLPTVSRAQFIRMIPTEKDYYNIKAKKINAQGKWDFLASQQFLEASQVTLDGVDANIFRSKIPKDDLTEKPLYSKLLRTIKFPLFIDNLNLKNSVLVYEEDTKKSEGPGKLTFSNFNLNAKNLNSGKMKGKPTRVPIDITCSFMNASPMKVKWSFDTAKKNDAFSISGNISNLPASRINPFIQPYLKIRATGEISDLIFNFNGDFSGIRGLMKMKHKDLKVSLLKKSGDKDVVLSAIANIFVKSNSGNFPESVEVTGVERDKTRSFFNLFWRGIEQGLKITLIGENAIKTGKNIQNSVQTTKKTISETKKGIQKTKIEIKEKVEKLKQKSKPEDAKEKGFFQKIFNKKSEK